MDKPTESAWSPGAHCPVLDGVRGLAILAVTLYRLCKEIDPNGNDALAWVRRLAPIGERGVDLFFVLSGFLITGILLRSRDEPHYFRNFIVRRTLRIFPLYFLSLIVGLYALPRLMGTEAFDLARWNQWYLWTYTSNLKMSWENQWCFGAFDHFWSLAVEEHFYLVWPAVVLLLSRRSLAISCTLGIVLVGVARTIAASFSGWDVAVSVATFFRADSLLIGGTIAIFLNSPAMQTTHRGLALKVAGLTFCTVLPLLLVVAFSGRRFLEIPSTLCGLLFASGMVYLLLSSNYSFVVRLMQSSPLRTLGRYSYGMYVVQLPLVTLIPLEFTQEIVNMNYPLLCGIYVVSMLSCILSVAIVTYHGYEVHFLRLKSSFTNAKHARNSSTSV
ncbi:acyltransferase family protein [Pirellulaceae bacterium SH449]